MKDDVSKEFCSHCNTDMQGSPIPEKYRDLHYGGATHYSRIIGISDLRNDSIVRWKCPDCEGEWDRKGNKLSDITYTINSEPN